MQTKVIYSLSTSPSPSLTFSKKYISSCNFTKALRAIGLSSIDIRLTCLGSKCDLLVTQQKRCLRSSNGKSRTAHTEPLLKTMNQLKLVDMYNSKLLKFYYKLYRNQLPCYFDSFLPTYGTSHYPLKYDGLHLPHANHKFCEVNAKYQLHKLLRAISHPLYAKERVFLIREEDTAIEVMILSMSPHQFSKFVKMAFVDSYRVDG